ncbi:MAG: VTT domain-containing protein [Planctomycetota bacterium]
MDGPDERAGWWGVVRLAGVSVVAVALPGAGVAALGYFGGAWAEALALPMWAAPLVALGIGVVCGLAVLPTHAASLASGYLLGLWVGLPTAVVGVVLAAALGEALARRLDSAVLKEMVGRRAMGRALMGAMLGRGAGRAAGAVALARLPPYVPFALGNVVAASLRVPRGAMLAGTAAGMLPRVGLVVWLGSELAAWDAGEAVPASLWWSIGAAVVGLGGLTVWAGAVLRGVGGEPTD